MVFRNVRDSVSLLNQIANFMAQLEQAVCRGTQNALCRVTADHTGNAPVFGSSGKPVYSTRPVYAAHGLNRRVTIHAGRKARTDRNDDPARL